jgi:hypothetical protein
VCKELEKGIWDGVAMKCVEIQEKERQDIVVYVYNLGIDCLISERSRRSFFFFHTL